MFSRELILFSFIEYATSTGVESCPDQELGDECDASCRIIFVTCRQNCADSLCEHECLNEYTRCSDSCPCFHDCPQGCANCNHPSCACKDPELSNPTYRQCIDEAASDFKLCAVECAAQKECFDGCYSSFTEESSRCPCMSECPSGCPCENGYKCQPFVSLISQSGSNYMNYLISADGHFKEDRFYSIPSSKSDTLPYLQTTGAAWLNGEMFLFGGESDERKIAKISQCGITELPVRLVNNFQIRWGGLVTVPTFPNEVLLCFGFAPHTKCENFNGVESKTNPSVAKSHHLYSCMALNDNMPTVIGGGYETFDHLSYPLSSKVETLGLSGWTYEQDAPKGMRYHGCVSLDHGLVTIGGGTNSGSDMSTYYWMKDVYLFRDHVWSFAGSLNEAVGGPSILVFDNYLMSFAGVIGEAVERATWNGTHVTESEKIYQHEHNCYNPIIFETAPDACSHSCENYCFP